MPMCCAIDCKNGYHGHPTPDGTTFHQFPHGKPALMKKWIKRMCRKDWAPTKRTVVCSSHFQSTDFQEKHADSHSTRKRKRESDGSEKLKKRMLKPDAVPTIFEGPTIPAYHKRKSPKKRHPRSKSPSTSAASRQLRFDQNQETKRRKAEEEDRIKNFSEIESRLIGRKDLPSGFTFNQRGNSLLLMIIELGAEDAPTVAAAVAIHEDLKYSLVLRGIPVAFGHKKVTKNPAVESMTDIVRLMERIKELLVGKEAETWPWLAYSMSCLEKHIAFLESENELKKKRRYAFLLEELQLAGMKPQARKFSPDLVVFSFTAWAHSPQSYRKLRELDILVLPSERTLRKIIRNVKTNVSGTGKSDLNNDSYLRTRIGKLEVHEKIVTLLLDEIYVAERLEFSAAKGEILGYASDGELATTCLSFMVQSVLSKYKDIVALYPMKKLTAQKLSDAFMDVLKRLVALGLRDLSQNTDLEDLFRLEKGKPLKIAHKLTQKVIDPTSVQKTSAKLSLAVFHQTTSDALKCYKGGVTWESTAEFIDYVTMYWNILNVKTTTIGSHTRDELREPITNPDGLPMIYLTGFAEWLREWEQMNLNSQKGLSRETFLANRHTILACMDLARYCLNDLGMKYVLLGKFQSDPLEGRFGYYRQLNGGNYYMSVRQLVENERKIRAISLIKFSQCSIQELKSMEATSCMAGTRDLVAKFVTHTEKSISQFEENFEIPDLNVLFFVAGALSRSELNLRRGCASCSDCLLENRQGTGTTSAVVIPETGLSGNAEELWKMISRGGLVRPRNQT